MSFSFTITEVVNNIALSITTSTPVNVTSQDISFTVTTTNQTVNLTQTYNTTTIYTDAVELKVDDFANYFMGDWTSGASYQRGDLVNYAYSLYVCSTGTLTTVATIIPPPSSPVWEWRRVVWHEAPFEYLNVTNTATINELIVQKPVAQLTITNTLTVGSIVVGGAAANGGIAVNGPLYIGGTSTFMSTATFNGGIDVYGNIGGSGATFTGPVTFNSTVTMKKDLNITSGTITAKKLVLGGLAYPLDKGLYGQVLSTDGSAEAIWSNLGDLVFWSLNDDLTTNGFDIWSGYSSPGANPRLRVGSGNDSHVGAYLDFAYGGETATLHGTNIAFSSTNAVQVYNGIRFGDGTVQTSASSGITGYTGSRGAQGPAGPAGGEGAQGPRGYTGSSGEAANFGYTGSVGYTGSSGAFAGMGYTGSAGPAGYNGSFGYTGSFGYAGSIGYTGSAGAAYTLPVATTSTLGGVKIGSGVDVTVDGTISVDLNYTANLDRNLNTNGYLIRFNEANSENQLRLGNSLGQADADVFLAANSDDYLRITPGFNSLSSVRVGTTGLNPNQYSDAYDEHGFINLYQPQNYTTHAYNILGSINTIPQSQAYGNNKYESRLWQNINEGNRLIYYINDTEVATLRVGGRSGNASVNQHNISIDIDANPYDYVVFNPAGADWNYSLPAPTIKFRRHNTTTVTESIILDSQGIALATTATVNITAAEISFTATDMSFTGVTFIAPGTDGNIILASTGTVTIGASEEASTLRVQRIYNYAGTYAPSFPAGIQFGDGTIQLSAWSPDQGIIG